MTKEEAKAKKKALEEEKKEIGHLHKQAEEHIAFEIGRTIAVKTKMTVDEFKEDINNRKEIRAKQLETFGLTYNEIEKIITSTIHEYELLEGFQFERRKI